MRLITYPFRTTEENMWEEFKRCYKEDQLGSNLDEALATLIKNHLKARENNEQTES